MSNGRGDLGFIPNQRAVSLSRTFMGHPGNLSKKGFMPMPALRLPSTAPPPAATVVEADAPGSEPKLKTPEVKAKPHGRVTNDAIISKRTEWLEAQEKRLSCTLEEQVDHYKTLKQDQEDNLQRFFELFNNTQWLYGKTKEALQGVRFGEMSSQEALDACQKRATPLAELSPKNKWVLLQHPMERISNEDGEQVLMKMRLIDSKTGQLTLAWAVVGSRPSDREDLHMSIGEFAATPR